MKTDIELGKPYSVGQTVLLKNLGGITIHDEDYYEIETVVAYNANSGGTYRVKGSPRNLISNNITPIEINSDFVKDKINKLNSERLKTEIIINHMKENNIKDFDSNKGKKVIVSKILRDDNISVEDKEGIILNY